MDRADCRSSLMVERKYQRWSRGHQARGQGQDTKKSKVKTKDRPSLERPSLGQGNNYRGQG